MGHDHAALEAARADAGEGDAVAVRGVHARLHLEDVGREGLVEGALGALLVDPHDGRGRGAHDEVEQVPHTDVEHGGAEEHGGDGGSVGVGRIRSHDRRLVVRGRPVLAELGLRLGRSEGVDARDRRAAGGAVVALHLAGGDVEQTVEDAREPDRPRDGLRHETGAVAQLVHEVECVAAGAIPLVDDGDDRDAPPAADVEQLHRLRLEAFRRIDEHDGRVDRREHAVGVLREVGVAGSVDEVDDGALVLELHGRRGDGDAAGLLHLHPVRHRCGTTALAVHGARRRDAVRVQEERLAEGRLSGVGVGDDGDRAATGSLLDDLGHATLTSRSSPAVRPFSLRPSSGAPRPGGLRRASTEK